MEFRNGNDEHPGKTIPSGDRDSAATMTLEGHATPGDLVAKIQRQAQALFAGNSGSHDWEHTQRVFELCRHIGSVEKVDMEVLLAAACLHDIGRRYQDASGGRVCHADKGMQMARPIVTPLPISGDRKANILHCIQAHRFRKMPDPATPEARVLFDADKLDAIGAVGVARAYLFAGELGARLHNPHVNVAETSAYTREDTGFREFKIKLSKIKDRMLTREGMRMAAERHAFMVAFFERLEAEHRGKI